MVTGWFLLILMFLPLKYLDHILGKKKQGKVKAKDMFTLIKLTLHKIWVLLVGRKRSYIFSRHMSSVSVRV